MSGMLGVKTKGDWSVAMRLPDTSLAVGTHCFQAMPRPTQLAR